MKASLWKSLYMVHLGSGIQENTLFLCLEKYSHFQILSSLSGFPKVIASDYLSLRGKQETVYPRSGLGELLSCC